MADSKEYMTLPEENGSINISEEVIAAIAVGAVREVEGVSGMYRISYMATRMMAEATSGIRAKFQPLAYLAI